MPTFDVCPSVRLFETLMYADHIYKLGYIEFYCTVNYIAILAHDFRGSGRRRNVRFGASLVFTK